MGMLVTDYDLETKDFSISLNRITNSLVLVAHALEDDNDRLNEFALQGCGAIISAVAEDLQAMYDALYPRKGVEVDA